jgi:hypothetical protein
MANAADEGEAVWFINRAVVVLRHREPFAAWARALDGEGGGDYEPWSEAFLVPEFEDEAETWSWIEEHHELFFEIQLDAWFTDRDAWPRERTWEMFLEWFDIEVIEMAWDLVDAPLSSRPPEPGGEE